MEQEQETRTCKRCGRELPMSEFTRNMHGITHVCKECFRQARQAKHKQADEIAELKKAIEDARQASLENFSPRELMAELYRRGYEGELLPPRIPINIKNM